ncbi:hypothetical protein QA089_002821 [Meyerozyma guilliermondii]
MPVGLCEIYFRSQIAKTLWFQMTSALDSVSVSEGGYDIEYEDSDVNTELQSFRIKYRSNSVISFGSGISETSGGYDTLPTIKVLGTGGTIAAKGGSSHQTAGYQVDLTIEDLIKSIPDLSTTCNLEYEQILNIDSKEFGPRELLMLHNKVKADLSQYDAIVITHGTDTMEETAFFLQMTINTYKPIVLCGSMRPSTAISSDGPMNLYQAIVIASTRESRNRGVLVALNDTIGSGFYITKSNANSLDTFKSIGQGYLGSFVNNEVHYYYPPAKPLGLKSFNLPTSITPEDLPEVPILFGHQGLNNDIISVVVQNMKPKGLVFATMGAGSMADSTNKLVGQYGPEFPVVYSKRAMDGMVPTGSLSKLKDDKGNPLLSNVIASGYLNPQKSRLLLQLCLFEKMSNEGIRKVFKGVYGG